MAWYSSIDYSSSPCRTPSPSIELFYRQTWECETCTRQFLSHHAVQQHMNALDHWHRPYSCDTCSLTFRFENEAQDHMAEQGHYENYCQPCDRYFANRNNLQMHLRSRIHQGAQVPCPFCATGFATASGLSHHLENSSCPNAPSLNRERILAIIRSRDRGNVITTKQIEAPEDGARYEASSQAWNGDFWECYLCHKEFNSHYALTMHLNSPRHKSRVYHCPNKRGCCARQFVSLAALFNHLESETCGYMRFENVKNHVHSIVTGRKMISM